MNTPQGGGGHEQSFTDPARTRTGNAIENGICCLMGLVAAVLIGFLSYSVFVTITQSLRYLSTTAIVFGLLFVWIIVWLGTEIIRERLTERIP